MRLEIKPVSIQRLALGISLIGATFAGVLGCHGKPDVYSEAPRGRDTAMNFYALKTNTLDGQSTSLEQYQGKVTLVVNVASYCGKTPQYAGLERLQKKYESQGFSVLGFPSNDFGKQEPGSAEEIREFCTKNYQVTFPLFQKLQTKAGTGQSPVYEALKQATGKLPSWNFGKYLVARDGKVIAFYPSNVEPDAPELVSALETALAAK